MGFIIKGGTLFNLGIIYCRILFIIDSYILTLFISLLIRVLKMIMKYIILE